MKMDWSRIVLTTLLVMIFSALVLAPMASAKGGLGGGMGGAMRGGLGVGGIHAGAGGISNIGVRGIGDFDRFGRGLGGIHDGIFRNRFVGTGFGGWPWWNNWGWPWWNYWGNPCYTNCVSQGLNPGYCSQVCGVY